MSPRRGSSSLAAVLCVLSAVSPAAADAISHPNQVHYHAAFTNTQPDIVAELNARVGAAFELWNVTASSVDTSPILQATRGDASTTRADGIENDLTVESSDAGIAYDVTFRTHRSDGAAADVYVFAPTRTAPVRVEPAPDVPLEALECAGGIRINWVDSIGGAAPVTSGIVRAFHPTPEGGEELQATDVADPDATTVLLLARGDGSSYRLEVDYTVGDDPFLDVVSYRMERLVTVNCDEVVEVGVQVGEGDGGGGEPLVLGAIHGVFDIVGEDERPTTGSVTSPLLTVRSLVAAIAGPWDNERFAAIGGTPASGPYELPNLMPSTVEFPPVPYQVRAMAEFVHAGLFEQFISPTTLVLVGNGETVDLGDDFVMTTALVGGTLRLAGPPREPSPIGSLLDDLQRPTDAVHDSDGDGVPDDERISSLKRLSHVSVLTSSPFPEVSAEAHGDFRASMLPDGSTLDGDYELALGLPRDEPVSWRTETLSLRLDDPGDPAVPESTVGQYVYITQARTVDLGPGDRASVDHRYCFSRVVTTIRSTDGVFYGPSLSTLSGGFDGFDFEGVQTAYTVSTGADGLPATSGDAAPVGSVVALLPEGDYQLRPRIWAVAPTGGASRVDLFPILLNVGCRQRLDVQPDLAIELDAVPPCAGPGPVRVSGRVRGSADIDRIECSVNGGVASVACTSCGVGPTFALDVDLSLDFNEVLARAVTVDGREVSVSAFTQPTQEPSDVVARPGAEPLRVARAAGGRLRVTWEDLVGVGVDLYRGTIASLWAGGVYDHHEVGACDMAGGQTTVDDEPGSVYFLAGGRCGWGDSPLGRDSLGRERAPARPRCP